MADRNLSQRWEEFRPSKSLWIWSCIGCVLATMIIGFTAGGWVTGGTAADMASDASDQARAQVVAGVCANRFMSAPDAAVQLSKLKETDSWKRDDMIEEGGWAKLASMEDVPSDAVDLCAEKLAAMEAPAPADATAAAEDQKAGG